MADTGARLLPDRKGGPLRATLGATFRLIFKGFAESDDGSHHRCRRVRERTAATLVHAGRLCENPMSPEDSGCNGKIGSKITYM
jgi:hypothetical protein